MAHRRIAASAPNRWRYSAAFDARGVEATRLQSALTSAPACQRVANAEIRQLDQYACYAAPSWLDHSTSRGMPPPWPSYCAVQPPSPVRAEPVTKVVASEARMMTALPSSTGSPVPYRCEALAPWAAGTSGCRWFASGRLATSSAASGLSHPCSMPRRSSRSRTA